MMLSKAHRSSARASAGALGCARALLLSIALAVLTCGGGAYADGLTITPPSAAAAQSEEGALPAAGAAVQPPAAAASSATSAVAQSARAIVPASAASAHASGHLLGIAAGAGVRAISAAPKGSSAGGHAASKLLASARNSAPAAGEVVVDVSHAVSRTPAPVAGAAHVLKARPLRAAPTPAQTLADALAAASRRGGGHLAARGREAIMRVLRPTTPAAAVAINRAAEALAGARGGSPSLPFPPLLLGLGVRPIPVLVRPPEAGLFELATGAAPAPTREVFTATAWASRAPCTIAAAEEQIAQRCRAGPLRVFGRGAGPFLAGAAALPSRGAPVETYRGGTHASVRSAPAPGAPSPRTGTGGPAGSPMGALGSAFPTLLLLAGLLLAGIPRLTRRLSLVRQRCIAAPLALIPERPG